MEGTQSDESQSLEELLSYPLWEELAQLRAEDCHRPPTKPVDLPYCQQCGKIFSRSDNMIRHQREVHGLKPRNQTPLVPMMKCFILPCMDGNKSLDSCECRP